MIEVLHEFASEFVLAFSSGTLSPVYSLLLSCCAPLWCCVVASYLLTVLSIYVPRNCCHHLGCICIAAVALWNMYIYIFWDRGAME